MDDLDSALELLNQTSIQTSGDITHAATSNKGYRELVKYWNVTSYSQLETLYRCPRKHQMNMQKANQAGTAVALQENIDFAYGHAVGAGVQNYLITGDLDTALLNCCLAWSCDFFAEIPKKHKSIWDAMLAVEKFAAVVWPELSQDWELLYLPNGKPAVETSFALNCGNGFRHYSHMDVGLRHKKSKRLAVVDVKTSGFTAAEEAIYANSNQSLSYSILLAAALLEDFVDYEVYYLVYSTPSRDWTMLPFTKAALDQAEWIKDLLLTQDSIKSYQELGFYPKRGNACYDFFRRCEYYGECNIVSSKPLPTLAEEAPDLEQVDFVINLEDVIASLKSKKARMVK